MHSPPVTSTLSGNPLAAELRKGITDALAKVSSLDHTELVHIICAGADGDLKYMPMVVEQTLEMENLSLSPSELQDLIGNILAQLYHYKFSQDKPASFTSRTSVKKEPPSVATPRTTEPSSTTSSKGQQKPDVHFITVSYNGRQLESTSNFDLSEPPQRLPVLPSPGDFYIHTHTATLNAQVWLYNKENSWEDITDIWANRQTLVHPNISERVLTIHDNGVPNWVLRTTLNARRSASRGASVGVQHS
ncbi:hypothetical protein FB451DRAFT_1408458 [Mycena latifolia]|nr:hypothetical protein FB451DRAFT_1408458 [Mycena latifolia]